MAVLDKAGFTYFWEKLKAILGGKAPTSHTATDDAYGAATDALFGHVRLASAAPSNSSDVAAVGTSPRAARQDHAHRHPMYLLGLNGDMLYCGTGAGVMALRPWDDNTATTTYNLGSPTYRFSNLYLINNPNVSSDRRGKTDIEDVDKAMGLIMALKPVQYRRIDGDDRLYFGLIAQEVRDALAELGIPDTDLLRKDSIDEDIPVEEATEDQVRYSLAYSELISPLIAVVQEQQKRMDEQDRRIAALEAIVFGGGGDD